MELSPNNWACLGNILDSDGQSKYSYLFTFPTIVLYLRHAKFDAEKGFSINEHLNSIRRNSFNEKTIVALGLVKDHLFKVGGPTIVTVTTKLFVSVKNSFQICNADHEAKPEYRERIEKKNPREKQRLRKINSKVRIYLKLKMI